MILGGRMLEHLQSYPQIRPLKYPRTRRRTMTGHVSNFSLHIQLSHILSLMSIQNYANYIRTYIEQQVAAGVKTFKITDLARRKDCKTLEDFTASNIMDYAYCLNNEFTPQQRQRTRHILQYSPLVPGPKLILYNTTGKVTRGINTPCVIEEHIQPCPPDINRQQNNTKKKVT